MIPSLAILEWIGQAIQFFLAFCLKAERYKEKLALQEFIAIFQKAKVHLPASMFEAMLIRFSLMWPVQALVKDLSQHCMPAIISIISVIASISFSE